MDQLFDNENTVPEMENNDPAAEFLAREQNAFADLENNQIDQNDVVVVDDENGIFQQNNDYEPNTEPFDIKMENFDMINGNEVSGSVDDDNYQDIFTNNNVTPRIDSEKIVKWRAEQKEILEKKDANEEIKKRELLEQAKNELDDWYKKHNELIEKTKTSNRNADKQQRNNDEVIGKIEPGTEWERIAKLCDFNSKTNKTNNKDVSRMRSILLQLKQN